MNTLEMTKLALTRLDEHKAEDTVVLNIESVSTLGDFFVITSGSNTTQVRALADDVEDAFSKRGVEPLRVERDTSNNWILLDYGDLMIHVFYRKARETYRLEGVWADAKKYTAAEFLRLGN